MKPIFRFSLLSALLLTSFLQAAAQDTGSKEYKTVVLTNGYEVTGKLIAETADSTIVNVDGSRLAYPNSVVKSVSTATNYEEKQVKRAKSKKKSGVDTLEINIKALAITDLAFNSMPSYGGIFSFSLPIAKNRLRLELGFGAQYLKLESKEGVEFNSIYGEFVSTYNAQLTIIPVTIDFGLSYDVLAKNPNHGLAIYVGSSTLIPISKKYEFIDNFSPTDEAQEVTLEAVAFPGVKAGLEYALSLGKGSALTLGYSFSYLFGDTKPAGFTGLTHLYAPSSSSTQYAVRSSIGGLHSFSIGYRHSISMLPKKKEEKVETK